MLDKMGYVIANPTKSDLHRAIIGASFGSIDESQRDKIKHDIGIMKNTNIRLNTTPVPWSGTRGVLERLHWSAPAGTNLVYRPDSVHFSDYVHAAPHVDKAGMLIRLTAMHAVLANNDAAHAVDVNDDTERAGNRLKITYSGESGTHVLRNHITYSGCRPTHFAQVNADVDWASKRDNTVNMQNSGEAHRIMAHLCDKSISNTDLYKRALLEGDKEAYHSILLRRKAASCPPNKKNAVLPLTNGH
jgi:hypothetical protein